MHLHPSRQTGCVVRCGHALTPSLCRQCTVHGRSGHRGACAPSLVGGVTVLGPGSAHHPNMAGEAAMVLRPRASSVTSPFVQVSVCFRCFAVLEQLNCRPRPQTDPGLFSDPYSGWAVAGVERLERLFGDLRQWDPAEEEAVLSCCPWRLRVPRSLG